MYCDNCKGILFVTEEVPMSTDNPLQIRETLQCSHCGLRTQRISDKTLVTRISRPAPDSQTPTEGE